MSQSSDPRNNDKDADTNVEHVDPEQRRNDDVERVSPDDGAISDEELDSVSGGMF